MQTFEHQFEEFLKKADEKILPFAEYFLFEHLTIYMRHGRRLFPDKSFKYCLQIANLSTDKKFQKKGTFDRFLLYIKEKSNKPIYIESILNFNFGESLLKRGFVIVKDEMDGMSRDMVLFRD